MIDMQIMIGQLTGEPIQFPLPDIARKFTAQDALRNKSAERTAKELEGDAARVARTLADRMNNIRKYYGNRIFSVSLILKERPFKTGKAPLAEAVEIMLNNGELTALDGFQNSLRYRFSVCENPQPFPKNTKVEAYNARVNNICDFVRNWSKANSRFSIPELRTAVENQGTAADDAVYKMIESGELIEMRDGRGKRTFKFNGVANGKIQSAA